MSNPRPQTTTVSLPLLSKTLSLSLHSPTLTDTHFQNTLTHLRIAPRPPHSITITPYHIPFARKLLYDQKTTLANQSNDPNNPNQPNPNPTSICAAISSPHGTSTTETKVFSAVRAIEEGATEVEVVINIGRVLSGKWEFVRHEIRVVKDAVGRRGGGVGVVFEVIYLEDEEIKKLCEICGDVGVAYVSACTGYAVMKEGSEGGGYGGATIGQLELMRRYCSEKVQIKVGSGIKTLDDLLRARALGVERVGSENVEGILDEARQRGIGEELGEVEVKWQ